MSAEISAKIMEYLKITAEVAGFGEPLTIPEIVGAVIGAFPSLLGIIFICLIIYGGYTWMTAGGNEYKVIKAKKILNDSMIGLVIILAAYSVTYFVLSSLNQVNQA